MICKTIFSYFYLHVSLENSFTIWAKALPHALRSDKVLPMDLI